MRCRPQTACTVPTTDLMRASYLLMVEATLQAFLDDRGEDYDDWFDHDALVGGTIASQFGPLAIPCWCSVNRQPCIVPGALAPIG